MSEIKTISGELNTLQSNSADTSIEKINGKLLAVLLDSNVKCHVIIKSKKHPEFVLLDDMEYSGFNYIPLKCLSFDYERRILSFAPSEYYLDEELEIIVLGSTNTLLKFEIRYI